MQFDELMMDFPDLDIVVFDREALVVFEKGSIPKDNLVIELGPILKDAERLELFVPSECVLKAGGHHVLMRQAGEYVVALVQEASAPTGKLYLDLIRVYNRLVPELD